MQHELIILNQLSEHYGKNKNYIIASGGNSSYKTDDDLWITASGSFLGNLGKDDILKLSRKKLAKLRSKEYDSDPRLREEQIKDDLVSSMTDSVPGKRPSVETSLHDLIEYAYIIHTHPTLVNGLLCSNHAETMTKKLFGDLEAMYVRYYDPGYTLFRKIEEGLLQYRREQKQDPKLIFIQNHGIFVGSDSPDEIKELYNLVHERLENEIKIEPDLFPVSINDKASAILPAIQAMFSDKKLTYLKLRNNALIESFLESEQTFERISRPFTPDIIVFCKSHYLYIHEENNTVKILRAVQDGLQKFQHSYGYLPKIILVKHLGIISVDVHEKYSKIVLDIFEDLIKISCYSDNFGGPHFMNDQEILFIEEWEAEKFRHEAAEKN